MRATFHSAVLLMLMIRSGVAANRVSTKDGRIVLEDPSGQKTALTQNGFDSDPWISPDGRMVLFLRHSAEEMFRTSVYAIDLRTRIPKVLYSGPAKYRGREGSYFGRPELDESHETLYLLSKEYATSGALISIRLATGRATLISDRVVGYDVILCPRKYRGDLVALKRYEEDLLGRPYFLYSRYSATGEDLGLAGGGELDGDMDLIRDDHCDEPDEQPSVSSLRAIPSTGNVVRMDESAMDRRLVTRVEPVYPSHARTEHIQGDVRFLVRVAADGTVQYANLVSGPPQLVGAAKAAVEQWRYRPVISAGRPVAVVTIVNIPFRLPSQEHARH